MLSRKYTNMISTSNADFVEKVASYYKSHVCYSLNAQASYLDPLLTDKNALIVSFWNKRPAVIGGIHTVLIEKDKNGNLYVHNSYNYAVESENRNWNSIESYLSLNSTTIYEAYFVEK